MPLKNFKLLFAFFLILLANFLIFIPSSATQAIEDKSYGIDATMGAAGTAGTDLKKIGAGGLPTTIGQIIGVLLSFVGTIFFILIIHGGFLWMVARGNEQEVTKAKDLISSAVIGLIIVLAAYAITTYIGTIIGQ